MSDLTSADIHTIWLTDVPKCDLPKVDFNDRSFFFKAVAFNRGWTVRRYVLDPDDSTIAAIQFLHDHFASLLSPEQRAALRGWLGRVAP